MDAEYESKTSQSLYSEAVRQAQPTEGTVYPRQPCDPIQLMVDVGQWLCVPLFRSGLPCSGDYSLLEFEVVKLIYRQRDHQT